MIKPSLLKSGDYIGIVAPSRVIMSSQLEKAFEIFSDLKLNVKTGDNLYTKHGYFAGDDSQRLLDLQRMIDDPEVKAIFCARGGYGMTRILDKLDVKSLLDSPKYIIGFSDITALHLKLNKLGIESIHGLMPVQYDYMFIEKSLNSLVRLLFEGTNEYEIKSSEKNRTGVATGSLIGGNLSLLTESLGTSTEINTKNKILFIEEIDEYLYKVDRMLMQLKRAGKLHELAGLIVGSFSEMKDTQIPFGKGIQDLIMHHVEDFNYPVAFDFPVGHESENYALPISRTVTLVVEHELTTLTI